MTILGRLGNWDRIFVLVESRSDEKINVDISSYVDTITAMSEAAPDAATEKNSAYGFEIAIRGASAQRKRNIPALFQGGLPHCMDRATAFSD